MAKIRILRTRNQKSNSQNQPREQDSQGFNADTDESISTEIVKKKPTQISKNGFTAWIRKIKPTRDGMESEVEEPLIIAKSGHRVKEGEIKGRCDVCGGYDSHIFNCHVYGCKKCLCLKHVYFFEGDDKKLPYCLAHYKQIVDEFDTWQAYENKLGLRKRNGK